MHRTFLRRKPRRSKSVVLEGATRMCMTSAESSSSCYGDSQPRCTCTDRRPSAVNLSIRPLHLQAVAGLRGEDKEKKRTSEQRKNGAQISTANVFVLCLVPLRLLRLHRAMLRRLTAALSDPFSEGFTPASAPLDHRGHTLPLLFSVGLSFVVLCLFSSPLSLTSFPLCSGHNTDHNSTTTLAVLRFCCL